LFSSLEYRFYSLYDFKIKEALVSENHVKGDTIFGRFFKPLFEEKRRQDTLKGTPEYNSAIREVCKLCMNSATGKMVENTDDYKETEFDKTEQVYDESKYKTNINGVKIITNDKTKIDYNNLLICGVMIYSY
jgi:hypothetical protein